MQGQKEEGPILEASEKRKKKTEGGPCAPGKGAKIPHRKNKGFWCKTGRKKKKCKWGGGKKKKNMPKRLKKNRRPRMV